MYDNREKIDASQLELKDTVVSINRVTKVVKGGKNLSFSALVVVGDGHGHVGFGVGATDGRLPLEIGAGLVGSAQVAEDGDGLLDHGRLGYRRVQPEEVGACIR